MTYAVKVKETLMDKLLIEAANPNEAINKAVRKFLDGALLPTSEKYIDVRFSVEEEEK